jgi:hypothetical protein
MRLQFLQKFLNVLNKLRSSVFVLIGAMCDQPVIKGRNLPRCNHAYNVGTKYSAREGRNKVDKNAMSSNINGTPLADRLNHAILDIYHTVNVAGRTFNVESAFRINSKITAKRGELARKCATSGEG